MTDIMRLAFNWACRRLIRGRCECVSENLALAAAAGRMSSAKSAMAGMVVAMLAASGSAREIAGSGANKDCREVSVNGV